MTREQGLGKRGYANEGKSGRRLGYKNMGDD